MIYRPHPQQSHRMSSLVVEAVGIGWQAVLSLSEVWRSTLLGNDPIASLQPVDNFSGPGSLTSGSAFSGLLALIVGTRGRSKLQNWGMALGGMYTVSRDSRVFTDGQHPVWDPYQGMPSPTPPFQSSLSGKSSCHHLFIY